MSYKFEKELRAKAEEFIHALIQAGIDVKPFPAMFRDYLVKISIGQSGYINIYYSDRNKSFSLKTHELRDKQLVSPIETCWNKLSGLTEESFAGLYQAYVDGSFLGDKVGYGAVILKNGQEVAQFSGSVEQYIEQRQVVGEIQATILVLQWCQENQVEEIEIFYDYDGIKKWATGEWKTNNEVTQHYAAYARESSTTVIWHKVKSHTRVRWNEVADELAKRGALSKVNGDNTEFADPLEALEAKAVSFLEFLTKNGISAEFRQIYNGQFARIVIEGGFFDLYNTAKRPMSPRLHAFKDKKLQAQVLMLWDTFESGLSNTKPSCTTSRFEEIEYYLEIFQPYRHLPFDFTQLAMALKKVARDEIDILAYHDDFDELKRIYHRIRSEE